MKEIQLAELVGGALQVSFQNSLERVLENMIDVNTPYKAKRSINIKLTFEQNEKRNDIKVHIDVNEKLAPQGTIETSLAFGRDLRTGEIIAEEYGSQARGQLSINDVQPAYEMIEGRAVDTETGEVVENNVIDLRQHG